MTYSKFENKPFVESVADLYNHLTRDEKVPVDERFARRNCGIAGELLLITRQPGSDFDGVFTGSHHDCNPNEDRRLAKFYGSADNPGFEYWACIPFQNGESRQLTMINIAAALATVILYDVYHLSDHGETLSMIIGQYNEAAKLCVTPSTYADDMIESRVHGAGWHPCLTKERMIDRFANPRFGDQHAIFVLWQYMKGYFEEMAKYGKRKFSQLAEMRFAISDVSQEFELLLPVEYAMMAAILYDYDHHHVAGITKADNAGMVLDVHDLTNKKYDVWEIFKILRSINLNKTASGKMSTAILAMMSDREMTATNVEPSTTTKSTGTQAKEDNK